MNQLAEFRTAVQNQLAIMSPLGLFQADITKDAIWDTYLGSFAEGTNPMWAERTEHDCNCCKQFIRGIGGVVAFNGYQVMTPWDITLSEGNIYQVVANGVADYVRSCAIRGLYLTDQPTYGNETTRGINAGGVMTTYEHLQVRVHADYVKRKDSIPTTLGHARAHFDVLLRSMQELTLDAAETVLELIEQNSLYRGEEHKRTVQTFVRIKTEFDGLDNDEQRVIAAWKTSREMGAAAKFRNTVIGTLLEDLSEGVDLEVAVKKFEDKVSGTNYKRPKALITKGMIDKAQKKCQELGITPSLARRFAVAEDVTVNNVIFADRSAKAAMGGDIFDSLAEGLPTEAKKFDKVEEVSIADFIAKIVPKADSIEMLMENPHITNLMSLLAPVNADAPNILKWDNNFSWAYNGDMADSMKERVKAAGGDVSGHLRYSIQWNDEGNNNIDFDAHCVEPEGNLISYSNMHNRTTGGTLDVDITSPSGKIAVENITWADPSKMQEGVYEVIVHNYSSRTSVGGFSAEVECDGVIHSFGYDKNLSGNEKVKVAKFEWTRAKGLVMLESLPSSASSREEWGVTTNNFQRVSMVMHSPNHWDNEETGNKHWFFILDGCKNPDKARGFYNEFLSDSLHEHRKVFEVLGGKMKAEPTDNQLSGVGFSSTQRNEVLFRVVGKMNRVIKVLF